MPVVRQAALGARGEHGLPAALHALCAHKLSRYKRPTSIVVVDAIAKNAVGKIDKAALRAAHTTTAVS